MSEQDYWTLEAMEKYGGSFVRALGMAGFHADAINLQKIKDTWPEYWSDYEEKGRVLQGQQDE